MQNANSCLAEIELLSSDASSENRRELLRRVTDLFFLTSEQHTPNDGVVFGNVMERIAYELEIEARAELSERICEIDKAPHHLVSRLASDEIEVAKPVLERSRVLTDTDLIQIAKSRGQTHLQAISKRPTLSAPVTDVIVDRGESEVLVEVTNNKGAEFSRSGIDQLAQKARRDSSLLNALGKRKDLPPDVMEDVKRRVAEKIKGEMAERQIDTDPSDVDALIEQGAANLDLDAFKTSDANLRTRAQNNELDEQEIVDHANAGRLTEVVHRLSVLSGLDPRMISHCLLKADIAALGILCKANDFQGTTFLALIKTRNGDQRIRSSDIARSMREYENLSVRNANRTLRFLKVRCNTTTEADQMPQIGTKSLWTAHHILKDEPQI
ncbi:MAG: DUF2336 domain-containing protein [Hyphomicrobiaceae bacterium]|nr:DUF2336 domain-containing protein [Hyphomicrobiaceae bacterium]